MDSQNLYYKLHLLFIKDNLLKIKIYKFFFLIFLDNK